jgi:hypothetical protein
MLGRNKLATASALYAALFWVICSALVAQLGSVKA